jgi:hypothetical protein
MSGPFCQLILNPFPLREPYNGVQQPPQFAVRPSTAATRVIQATDMASVSNVIHTDNQLQPGQFGKAAYTEWIRLKARRASSKACEIAYRSIDR